MSVTTHGSTTLSKDIEMLDPLSSPDAFLNRASINQTILGKIVAAKQEWVAARKLAQPLESFQGTLVPSDRDFEGDLRAGSTRFILECKKASPSKGLIRDDFSPEAIADIYGNYATAISVLTDEQFFQGDFAFLPRVRGRVKQPVLCKDFMIDPYQVYLARHYQADAILLMLSVLTDEGYRALFKVAKELGLGVLTEVSNEEELTRAIDLGAPVIGINNRDLRDLSVDLARTKQLAKDIPSDRVVISESGINHRAQVADLRAHAKGFLVGSSLMSEPDLEAAVRKLVLGQNKVCGLTRPEDAAAAHQAGAVFGGLIFVAKSPRYVDIPAARAVMAGAPLCYVMPSPPPSPRRWMRWGSPPCNCTGMKMPPMSRPCAPCCRQAARSGKRLESQAASPCPPSTTRRIACCWIRKSAARAAAPVRRSTGLCWPISIKPG